MTFLDSLFADDDHDDERDTDHPGTGWLDEDDEWDIGQVAITCDNHCGTEFRGDFHGETSVERFAAAREFLAGQGWKITPEGDICPGCSGGEG